MKGHRFESGRRLSSQGESARTAIRRRRWMGNRVGNVCIGRDPIAQHPSCRSVKAIPLRGRVSFGRSLECRYSLSRSHDDAPT
jgi:hypothetical protein